MRWLAGARSVVHLRAAAFLHSTARKWAKQTYALRVFSAAVRHCVWPAMRDEEEQTEVGARQGASRRVGHVH